MGKKNIDMVAIETRKANAQNMTCFVAFIAITAIAAILMLMACILPVIVITTKLVCWVAMALEAIAIGLGYVAYWIKRNTLG
jgi:hypothetical protein